MYLKFIDTYEKTMSIRVNMIPFNVNSTHTLMSNNLVPGKNKNNASHIFPVAHDIETNKQFGETYVVSTVG